MTGSLFGNTQTRGNGPTAGPAVAAATPPLSHRTFQAFWKSSAFACVRACVRAGRRGDGGQGYSSAPIYSSMWSEYTADKEVEFIYLLICTGVTSAA